MTQPPRLLKERLFRQTPGVHFSDIGVSEANGLDLVVHSGFAVSPNNNDAGEKRFYIHQHQTDNNRCIQGTESLNWLQLRDSMSTSLSGYAGR